MQNQQIYIDFTAEQAKKLIERVMPKFLAKMNDYGVNDLRRPDQVLQRMDEKIGRIRRLQEMKSTGMESAVADEREGDTADDLIGYSIILTLMFNKRWGIEGFEFMSKCVDAVIESSTSDTTKDDTYEKFVASPIEREDPNDCIQYVQNGDYQIDGPKKDGDVGYDLYVAEDTIIPHNTKRPIDVATGVSVKLPIGTWAMIINRSSTSRKHGIDVVPGVIDNGYTGPLFACCWNRTGEDITIKKGERLAQLLIFSSLTPGLIKTECLPITERATSGFGSTDK